VNNEPEIRESLTYARTISAKSVEDFIWYRVSIYDRMRTRLQYESIWLKIEITQCLLMEISHIELSDRSVTLNLNKIYCRVFAG
jgi:hypothetical protein